MRPGDWQIVRSTPLFSAMPMQIAQSLIGPHDTRSFDKGSVLFQQGTPAERFFVILDGWVKLYRIAADGAEAVVGVFRRGETFAEADILVGGQHPVSAEVVTKSRLLAIDGAGFRRRIREQPDLAFAMLASSSQHLKLLVEHIELLKLLDAPQRVADFLLRLCGQSEGTCTVVLPYEKSLIAKRLGMKPESLSRALSKLRPLGVAVERDIVRIADAAALRRKVSTFDPEEGL